MSKIGLIIALVLSVIFISVFLPIIKADTDGVEYNTLTESFVAVNDIATIEVITTANTIYSVTSVTINDVALETNDYTVEGTINIDATASEVDDEIDVVYVEVDVSTGTLVTLLKILPLILVTVVVVYFVKFNK